MAYQCVKCGIEHAGGYICWEPHQELPVIQVKHRKVYGEDIMEICDPSIADAVAQLTKKNTVSYEDLGNLMLLGFQVEDLDITIKDMFYAC